MTVRCPECRTRRASFVSLLKHVEKSGHKLCRCGGYHYAHRPFSPFCVQNPMSDVNVARQQGGCSADELAEIAVTCAWEKPGRPFTRWRD